MCSPAGFAVVSLLSTGVQTIGTLQQASAQSSMYKYQAGVNRERARQEKEIAEQNVELTKRTSEQNRILTATEAAEESKGLARKTTELKGAQRAAIGKLGIGGVTAEDIVSSTFDKAKLDQMAIQYNADIKGWAVNEEAKERIWGIREQAKRNIWTLNTEAEQYEFASKNAKRAGYLSAAGTLLGGAASTAYGYSALKIK